MESSESKRSRGLGYAHRRRRRKTRSLMMQGRVKKGCSRAHRENVRESNAKFIHRPGCILLLGCAHRGVPNKGIIIGLAAAALRRESRTKRRCCWRRKETSRCAPCAFVRFSVSLSLSPFFVRPVHTSHFASVCEFALKATRFQRRRKWQISQKQQLSNEPIRKGFAFIQAKRCWLTQSIPLSKKKSGVASISELSFSTLALNGTARCLLPVIVFVVGAIYRSI